jgi:hypothetical protein
MLVKITETSEQSIIAENFDVTGRSFTVIKTPHIRRCLVYFLLTRGDSHGPLMPPGHLCGLKDNLLTILSPLEVQVVSIKYTLKKKHMGQFINHIMIFPADEIASTLTLQFNLPGLIIAKGAADS